MAILLSRCKSIDSNHLQYILISLHVITILACGILLLDTIPAKATGAGICLVLKNVERWDFLYIRKRPDHRSEKVGAIAPNTSSPIIVTGKCTPNTINLKHLWCPIEYFVTSAESRRGYIKMYYTRSVECPPSVEFYRQK